MNESAAPTWAEFAEGWALGIYSSPILCGIVAGLVLGYIGVFVVLRRMVFVTVALSQASGLGVALSFFAGIYLGVDVHPVVGALAVTLLAAVVFATRLERIGLSRESVIGLAYLGTWAASILIGEKIAQEAHDISAILFGTAVMVEPIDVILVVTMGVVVLLVYLLFHRGFVFAAFDPVGAEVQGVPARLLDLTGWVLLALEVSVATRALGVLPVFAFAVLPAMTALMVVRRRIRWVLVLAALIGAVSGGGGYLAAFFLELPVGACQAAVAVIFFLAFLPVKLLRPTGARG